MTRYVSQACYSLGYHPIQSLDVQIGGVAYGSWFGPQVNVAQQALLTGLSVAADTFIGSTPQLSGAVLAS